MKAFAFSVLIMLFSVFSQAQTLQVTSPRNHVRWKTGEYHAITWTGVSTLSRAVIEFSSNAGDSWNLISDQATDNSYIWKIPKVSSDYCLVRVKAKADTILLLQGHSGFINTGSFSNDGNLCVTASDDRSAIVWNAQSGELLKKYSGHTGDVMFATFSPNDSLLLTTSSDNTGRVWDVKTGSTLYTLTGHSAGLVYSSFSPDGSLIATSSEDGTVKIWSSFNGELLKTLRGHTGGVYSAFFHPAGNLLITGGRDQTVKIWDIQNGTVLKSLLHPGVVHWAVWNSDASKIVVGCRDNNAWVWDAATFAPLAKLEGHTDWVWSAEFSVDSKYILTGGRDGVAKIWDANTYKLVRTIAVSNADVGAARFSRTRDRILTASNDSKARIYVIDGARELVAVCDSMFSISDPTSGVQDDFLENLDCKVFVQPNPVKEDVTFDFVSKNASSASIQILDALGNIVACPSVQNKAQNVCTAAWNCLDVPSSTYYCLIDTGSTIICKSFVVIH